VNYLVTGAAGFIGAAVVRRLVGSGDAVIALDRQPNAPDGLAGAPTVTYHPGDVSDLALLMRLCQDHGVERIVHLAGELHARSAENPWACISSNVIGTHNVLEVGRILRIQRIVTASSAAVFGHPRRHPPGPIANDASLHAGDVYEASKIFGETEGAFYARAFGVDNAALRIGLVYGLECRIGWAARFVDELIVKPMRGERGQVPWRESTMNWTYIEDAADAFVRTARTTGTGTHAYNVPGDPRTIQETVEVVRAALPGADIEALPGEHEWAQVFDGSALRADTGFEPRWTLEAGVADIIRQLDVGR
jgi:nucleoside-diphosphate-sugar epimerase